MAEVIRMPKLSDTMTEGVVAEWHKKVGDNVEAGELLADIETDKATMEFESFNDGVLLHIGVEKGAGAPVDSVLAVIGEKDEDISALLADLEKEGNAETDPPEEISVTDKQNENTADKADNAEFVAPLKEPVSTPVFESNGRVKISPLAKKMAEDRGYDVTQIQGTGEGGRIVKKDVETYVPSQASSVTYASGVESSEEVQVSQMRKTIARRLGESKYSAPHFYLTIDLDMTAAAEARKQMNQDAEQRVSFNDIVIKAAAVALKKHPYVNSSWQDDKIVLNHHVHIGVAVAVDEGLIVPVVRHADTLPLRQIGAQVKELASKARDKKLQPSDWEGNTFSISNLGMFGIEEFTAIINPPDSAILAIGAIRDEVVVFNEEITVRKKMKVTMSCDHRVVDGATGAQFLQTFKSYIENPVMMLA
ncbi:MAG TPA: pyruvate dehydrogenase complex dihydrolipoamide acetyltransferase [Flavobacteriales bacterium]|jgi:pyruvate dehydrogenase E2 component (dihydrolipoamide acetyltransferase)|nr:pyruvate dehydrogenase complex dihydrolipoamide acetyltransferase [Flavobacteriales bacterium]